MGTQTERREFLRIDDVVPVHYNLVPKPKEELKKTTRKNISGGGIKIIVEEEVPKRTQLNLKFELPDPFQPISISALGEVIWVEKILEEGKVKYGLGIKFLRINEDDRKKIIKYVFEQHRRMKLRQRM